MEVTKTRLDSSKFKNDFSRLIGNYLNGDDKEKVINELVDKISVVNGSALNFLNSLETITEKKIRIAIRCATIAQMYNAKIDYRSGYPYVDSSANSEELVFIKFEKSTVVVSKNGEIIIDNDEIELNPRNNFGQGWPIRDVVTKKYGFISNNGAMVLPCVFDTFRQHIGEINPIYNNGTFNLSIYGQLNSLKKEDLENMVDLCDDEDLSLLICVSKDSILFHLRPWGQEYPYHRGDIRDVKELLSEYVVSKEKMQKILASR